MKHNPILSLIIAGLCMTANAQTKPESYYAMHNDSCWHFTLNYDNPKMRSNEGMVVITHLCTPDTCVSSATRHLQGKRYAKRYVKRYGSAPELQAEGASSCTLAVPESAVRDTVYAITYSEYSNGKETEYACDTMAICMPPCPPMSCHRVDAAMSIADHLAMEHPNIHRMAYYTPLDDEVAKGMDITPNVVRYVTNSSKLNPEYLQNAQNIEELMSIINEVLADSTTTLEAVQIVGYSSPDGSEYRRNQLGIERAIAMRDHIRKHHHLPDSLFEVANGGTNWNMIYADIQELGTAGGDTLISRMKAEPDVRKREAMLKRYQGGILYRELTERMFPAHRMACCTGIYYHNRPDSVALAVNDVVDELMNNPNPDYRKLIRELKQYRNDPRILNLQGVIEYRRHHRHAAERAFAKAAAMGDEQAAINLQILENNKNME